MKRFANETSYLWPAHSFPRRLLAVSAGQDYLRVRSSLRIFGDYLIAGGPRNCHVQQNHIDLAPARTKHVDRDRSISSFEHLKAAPSQDLSSSLPQYIFIFHHQYGGVSGEVCRLLGGRQRLRSSLN